ncbi:MAG: helix-turn-helix domain-containing protein [Alphaproteobacteria bacterium]|nr:helix-turn-helix domain-containing protein [Alphaproteobacteria bacterium]
MLDTEDESFTALLNRARMQLATHYIRNQRMRVTDIAQMPGYSSIGAFTRWYAQAFGESRLDREKISGDGWVQVLIALLLLLHAVVTRLNIV